MEALAKIDQALCARGDVFLGHPVLRTMVAPSYTQDAKAVSAQSMMLVALTSVAAIIAYVAGNGVNPDTAAVQVGASLGGLIALCCIAVGASSRTVWWREWRATVQLATGSRARNPKLTPFQLEALASFIQTGDTARPQQRPLSPPPPAARSSPAPVVTTIASHHSVDNPMYATSNDGSTRSCTGSGIGSEGAARSAASSIAAASTALELSVVAGGGWRESTLVQLERDSIAKSSRP